MDSSVLTICIFALLFGLLLIGMPIGIGMIVSAFVGMLFLINLDAALSLLGQTAYETGITYELSVLPMFLLMGQIAGNAGLSEALYASCNKWLGHRRGGLALATVGGCGAFAAICGSSLATAATMAKVALPEMRRYNYADSLACGSIAAGGTLGILIPPSVLLVLYGIITETSISDLFLAGMVPGVILVAGFMIAIAIQTRINPELGPAGEHAGLKAQLLAIKDVWGTVLLFGLVIGGLYTGIFSPTEAAGIGCIGAVAISVLNRTFRWPMLTESLIETIKLTSMIFTIIVGAIMFNNFLVIALVPNVIADWLAALPLGRLAILIVILLLYIGLGCILDSGAMVLLTVPIFFPIMKALGYDLVWFGILVVVVTELGLISPPIGINVFVIHGLAKDVELVKIFKGVIPFVIVEILLLIALVIWPNIALWLPYSVKPG